MVWMAVDRGAFGLAMDYMLLGLWPIMPLGGQTRKAGHTKATAQTGAVTLI